ncbi:MAG: helix-turn-helix transcriptional regulator [Candidatus Heimdallarchaeota archaeon]|nr:MAG: helix-turn-helix transcriptional regulator [Candidatus Heimdallarchaeota archaeon]
MVEECQILFDHWEKIPSFEYVDVPKDKYYSHPVKSEIVKLLKEGIEEKSPDGKSKVRHALNVIEIKELLERRKNIDMSPTNLYFHLDILQEMGLIKIVATLQKGPHGRNKVKYFGRVARNLFVSSEAISISNYTKQFNEFQKLANILKLQLPKDYSNLPQKLLETKQQFYRVLGNWLVDYEELIEREKLDLGSLYEFLKVINAINPEYNNLFHEVFSLLKQEISGL